MPGTLDPDTVAVILGHFATATTVVALDPGMPPNRVETIAAVLTEHGYQTAVRQSAPVTPTNPAGRGPVAAGPGLDDVASIQFTSGSTGKPKAVLHTHGLWLADAQLLNHRFGMSDGRRVALCMPISFAGGLNVLLGSLVGGAEILGIDPREHSASSAFASLRDHGAQVVACTPTFVDALHAAAQGDTLPDVERIVTTGEPTQIRHVRLARELAPNAIFTNWAGSTETLAIASHDILPDTPLPRGVVPVGRPAPHKKIELTEGGVVSISSRYIGPGYLDPSAATASFVAGADSVTTYLGGDVGRWDENGHLVFSGRADSTVKIRGYLVEPAEIEATLAAYEDVREVVVVADPAPTPTLTAYLAPSSTARTPSVAELRTRLHRELPPWMVPAGIVIVGALPRGDRGKVDRSALPKPNRPEFEAPRGLHEPAVAELWAQILQVDSVGRADSFYALGGDSLAATRMLLALKESHGVDLTPSDLAGAPTVGEFAARLDAGATPGGAAALKPTTVALRPVSAHTTSTPLFCFTGAGASALCFLPLAERIGKRTAVYAFEPNGLHGRAFPDWSVKHAVRRHRGDLGRIQPHGPYTLIGHSLGAHVALETARQLEAEGETVEMVVLLDPWLSPRVARRARHHLPDATVTLETDEANGFRPWWERQKRLPLAGLLRTDYNRRTLAVEEAGMIAGYRHRPQPWAGRALLILSHLNRDDPRLWPQFLTGQVQTHVLDCDHHSIVRPPHVDAVVDLIRAAHSADAADRVR